MLPISAPERRDVRQSNTARISIIVAVADNGVIGRRGGLPWRLPSDLRRFRQLTFGKPVIMGRKTFDALGKPLAGRDNIVISRQPVSFPHAHVAGDLNSALALAQDLAAQRATGEIMIIGGAEIYRAALPLADRLYVTHVHGRPEGDTSFADIDREAWCATSREFHVAATGDEFAWTLVVYDRQRRPRRC